MATLCAENKGEREFYVQRTVKAGVERMFRRERALGTFFVVTESNSLCLGCNEGL